MSRIVRAKPFGLTTAAAAAAADSTPGKDYLDRVAKYVPAEIIAAYLAISSGLTNESPQIQLWVASISFAVCLVFTPIYLRMMAGPGDKASLRVHQWVACFAFAIWAYAMSSSLDAFKSYYHGAIASTIMILFTVISGVIVPTAPAPKAQPAVAAAPPSAGR